MKKILLLILSLVMLNNLSSAEVTGNTTNARPAWDPELISYLNLAQSEYDNWIAGGEDAVLWQGTVDGKIVYEDQLLKWEQTGHVQYGQTRLAGDRYKKSVDQLIAEQQLYYKWKTWINPFASVKWETQLTDSYDEEQDGRPVISGFMDPGYLTESLGFGYQKEKWFKTRLGAAAKQTFADRFAAVYTDEADTDALEKMKNEFGLESVTTVNWTVMKNISLKSELSLFSNLKALDQTDIKWENRLVAKVNSIVSVNLNVDIIYDRDVSTARQLKEVLSLGLTYVLVN